MSEISLAKFQEEYAGRMDEPLPTVNYKYEKRQKELEKKKKKAEKTRLKEIRKNIKPEEKPIPASDK